MPFFFLRNRKSVAKDKPKGAKPDKKAGAPKIGLAFGGGGARGFAHIGALKAFEEAHIKFDMVAGTSVGSILAAAYACGMTSDALTKIADNLQIKDIKNNPFFIPGDARRVGDLIKQTMGDLTFEALPLPVYIVAVDLVTSAEVVLSQGGIASACSASCAVPFVFRPVERGNQHLVDGGLLNNIPADVLKANGADKVVSIDINPTRNEGTDSFKIMEVLRATVRIMMANSSFKGYQFSDVMIQADTSDYSSGKKDGYREMIRLGYEAAKRKIPEIKRLF